MVGALGGGLILPCCSVTYELHYYKYCWSMSRVVTAYQSPRSTPAFCCVLSTVVPRCSALPSSDQGGVVVCSCGPRASSPLAAICRFRPQGVSVEESETAARASSFWGRHFVGNGVSVYAVREAAVEDDFSDGRYRSTHHQ